MRHGCLLFHRVHAVTLLDQRVKLLQDVRAVLITLRVPLTDQRQLPVPGVVPAEEQAKKTFERRHKRRSEYDIQCGCCAAIIGFLGRRTCEKAGNIGFLRVACHDSSAAALMHCNAQSLRINSCIA